MFIQKSACWRVGALVSTHHSCACDRKKFSNIRRFLDDGGSSAGECRDDGGSSLPVVWRYTPDDRQRTPPPASRSTRPADSAGVAAGRGLALRVDVAVRRPGRPPGQGRPSRRAYARRPPKALNAPTRAPPAAFQGPASTLTRAAAASAGV